MMQGEREAVMRSFVRSAQDLLPDDGVLIVAFPLDPAGVDPEQLAVASNMPRWAIKQMLQKLMAQWDIYEAISGSRIQ